MFAAAFSPALFAQAERPLPRPAELPVHDALPDPLVMFDGRKVTSAEMWRNERRPELLRLFQHYMYGQLPPKPEVRSEIVRTDPQAFGGKGTLREITLRFGPPNTPAIHLMLIVPNRRTGPAPVVLGLNYFGNHALVADPQVRLADNWMPERGVGVVNNRSTEASRGSRAHVWQFEHLLDRGYASATFYNGDVDFDSPDHRGIQNVWPAANPEDECGTVAAWAWGLHRAVDYLVTAPEIDARRIVVTGHSRLGKAALVAAAFDERIALAIPHQAGAGGSAPSRAHIAQEKRYNTVDTPRTKRNETVRDLNTQFPRWFGARFKEFNDAPERLPFDQNCLIALCAPRAVLLTNGRSDTWINPAGQFEVLRAAAPVYRLLGAGDFTATSLPPDAEIAGEGALGYYLRQGGHSLLASDWKAFLDFADRQFGLAKASEHPGAAKRIVIDPEHPRTFRHRDGTRFFPLGDTAYFLLAQPEEIIAHFIDVRRKHGFNFIRMLAVGEGFWAFGGTPAKPDFATIDEQALRKLDWVFNYAESRGMNIELILWGYGAAGGEGLWRDASREGAWVDTIARRYIDRPNLFFYTVANEFERYPDGKYHYAPGDVAWARRVAARIHSVDAARPVSAHPSVWITDQGGPDEPRPFATYQSFTQRRPQIVWPLWDGSEVNLNATQNNEGVQPRAWGALENGGRGLTYYPTTWQGTHYPATWTATGWALEGAGMEDAIAEDWISGGKPVLNTEFGYQYEPGCESSQGWITRQMHQPASVRKKAWRIATAGGYFAAGFGTTPTARTLTRADVENFRPGALTILHEFFTTRTEYWTLAPRLELVAAHNSLLANPGVEYIAYFPRGGSNTIELAAGLYRVEWLHPETGRYFPQPSLDASGGPQTFVPPEQPEHDWVLHLRRAK